MLHHSQLLKESIKSWTFSNKIALLADLVVRIFLAFIKKGIYMEKSSSCIITIFQKGKSSFNNEDAP
jgi:hypothetical protein